MTRRRSARRWRGVARVFLSTPHGDPERVARFVKVAERAGVEQIVRLSGISAGFSEETAHRQAERAIEASGLRHTFLRPNFFMQNFTTWYAPALRDGLIRLPAGGRSRRLHRRARHCRRGRRRADDERARRPNVHTLTGGEALSHGEVAQIFGDVLGREVSYDAQSEDEADAGAWRLYGMVRDGSSSTVTGDVERALGRPPGGMADFVRDYASVWGS